MVISVPSSNTLPLSLPLIVELASLALVRNQCRRNTTLNSILFEVGANTSTDKSLHGMKTVSATLKMERFDFYTLQ